MTWLDVEANEDIRIAGSFEEFVEGLVLSTEAQGASLQGDAGDLGEGYWRPETISCMVEEPNGWSARWRLCLNNALLDGEQGWTVCRLSMPRWWEGAKVGFDSADLEIAVRGHGTYVINSDNFGMLGEALLGASDVDDAELQRIWDEIAGV